MLLSKDGLTTSVTETSGSASIGATKKPARILLAAHWPFECIYGLSWLAAYFLYAVRLLTPTSAFPEILKLDIHLQSNSKK